MRRHARSRMSTPRGSKRLVTTAESRAFEIAVADWATLALAAGIGLAIFVLYALTAARDIVLGDSAEFVTVAATLGVAHPSGYPLFSLLEHAMPNFFFHLTHTYALLRNAGVELGKRDYLGPLSLRAP